jgi:histidinol-phosphate phosphatase family protein
MRPHLGVDIVVPTVGRPALGELLRSLAAQPDVLDGDIVLVDDRRDAGSRLLPLGVPAALAGRVRIVRGPAAGPAAARNAGWRACRAEWVSFLDDDVVPVHTWAEELVRDLAEADPSVAGVQGRLSVPLPADRAPTDWERNVAGLEGARWATADMAYRRAALAAVGGFDERFPRAYREDADLGLRITRRGYAISRGRRRVVHPVRPAPPTISLRLQAGNADDVLMTGLHGRRWRADAGAPRGRAGRHVATAAAGGLAAITAGATRGIAGRLAACAAGVAWAAGTAELAWARIAPGPRTGEEVAKMVLTSVLMPPVATFWRVAGLVRRPSLMRDGRGPRPSLPAAVLFDRDGTLVVDVPYNGDPARVVAMPRARAALDRLRAAGVRLAVISNQSGVGRGLITSEQVEAVNSRVEELLGPLGPWVVCPHAPDAGCDCRKPAPGLVLRAAGRLGVAPARCVVIGDIGADVEAAAGAGAGAVLVPTERTLPGEITAATATAPDLEAAVDLILGERA